MNSRRAMVLMAAVTLTGLILQAAANDVPLNLPRPDGKPGDVKMKGKVYLLAGQSNMNGMGEPDCKWAQALTPGPVRPTR